MSCFRNSNVLAVKGGLCAGGNYPKDDEKTGPKKEVGSFLLKTRLRRTMPTVFRTEWSSLFSTSVAGRARNYWPEVKQELIELPKEAKNPNWLWQDQDLHHKDSSRDSQECCGRATDSITRQAFSQLYVPSVLCVSCWCRRKQLPVRHTTNSRWSKHHMACSFTGFGFIQTARTSPSSTNDSSRLC